MTHSDWAELRVAGKELEDARLQCHHALQLNTRLARGFVEAQADDSHTSVEWDWAARALTGQPVAGFRLGLRIADLTLVFIGPAGEVSACLSLNGRTIAEASAWLGSQLRALGLDPTPLADPIHFALDDHPLLHGARFQTCGREASLQELANWYGNTASLLSSIGSPVRCWPHHFDIATQVSRGEHSIGVGMSPGDTNYVEPYFYVTPWPYPDTSELPSLSIGSWHTNGWVGAVLTATEILREPGQQQFVEEFLDESINAAAHPILHVGEGDLALSGEVDGGRIAARGGIH
jgi:hypothetical protein